MKQVEVDCSFVLYLSSTSIALRAEMLTKKKIRILCLIVLPLWQQATNRIILNAYDARGC